MKIILFKVQEESKKELKIIMVDTKTHTCYIHSVESGHDEVSESHFQIIGNGYHHHTRRREISEALFIKNKKPPLNEQDKSIPLQLFN